MPRTLPSLPGDVLVRTMQALTAADVGRSARVCRALRRAARRPHAVSRLKVDLRRTSAGWELCPCTRPRAVVVSGQDGRDDVGAAVDALRAVWDRVEELYLDCAWHGWLLAPQPALRRLSWRTLYPLTGGPVPAAVVRIVAEPASLAWLDLPCLHLTEPYHARFWSRAVRLRRAAFDRIVALPAVVALFAGFPALETLRVGRALVPGSGVHGGALCRVLDTSPRVRALTLADTPAGRADVAPRPAANQHCSLRVLDGFGAVPHGVRWLGVWDRLHTVVVHHFGHDPYEERVGLFELVAAAAGRVAGELRVLDAHWHRLQRDMTSAGVERVRRHARSIGLVRLVSGDAPWERSHVLRLAPLRELARVLDVRVCAAVDEWKAMQAVVERALRAESVAVRRLGSPRKGAWAVGEWSG